jgi:hypothetical protein
VRVRPCWGRPKKGASSPLFAHGFLKNFKPRKMKIRIRLWTLASKRFVAKFLQRVSAPVYRLTLTGHADFDFLNWRFYLNRESRDGSVFFLKEEKTADKKPQMRHCVSVMRELFILCSHQAS